MQTPDCPEPSLLEIPFITWKKYDPKEIEAVTREKLSKVPFTRFDPHDLEGSKGVTAVNHNNDSSKKDSRRELLNDLLQNPFISQKDRALKFGKSQEEMAKIMNQFEENGLVIRQSFGLGRGAPKEGALLMELGLKWIGAKKNIPGRGSLQARYVVHRLKQEVFPNSCIEVEGCDLLVFSDSGKGAVEMELGGEKEEHYLTNIQRDVSSGYDWVLVLSMAEKSVKKMEKKAKERLDTEVLRKVTFKTVSEVLRGN